MELRAVGGEDPAPAAAGVLAVAGLQPGRDVPERDSIATTGEAGGTGRAGLEPAGPAAEHRREHHPGARREIVHAVDELADHLVAGHERQRHERREVERGPPGERREVGAADAREPRPDTRPAGIGRLGVLPVHEADRSERTSDEPGCPPAHRSGREVPPDRPVDLEREAHRTAGLGNRTRGVPPDISQISIGHRPRFAIRNSAESGETTTGFPTARSNGRSEWLSAYA